MESLRLPMYEFNKMYNYTIEGVDAYNLKDKASVYENLIVMKMQITIYSKNNCVYYTKLRTWWKNSSFDYKEKSLEKTLGQTLVRC